MTDTVPKGITFHIRQDAPSPLLRVAAYCRIASDSPEQQMFAEEQRNYYTKKILDNPQWTMAGIFADVGVSGSPSAKRPEFRRMLRQCRQKKIDLILVKSVSCFGRRLSECRSTIQPLRKLGIAVIFEKENINTSDAIGDPLLPVLIQIAKTEFEHFTYNSVHLAHTMPEGKRLPHGRRNPK